MLNRHEIFGNPIEVIGKQSKFTKVFHYGNRVTFSRDRYEVYWHRLLYRVDKNTNAIYRKVGNRIVLVSEKKHLAKICDASQSSFYEFYKECLAGGYIQEFPHGDKVYFIINPRYARNGKLTYQSIEDLFPTDEDGSDSSIH